MSGWKLRPAAYVVQVVYEENGKERVMATTNHPVTARILLRRLERRYPSGPPPEGLGGNGNGTRRRR